MVACFAPVLILADGDAIILSVCGGIEEMLSGDVMAGVC